MGKVVTFASLPYQEVGGGIKAADVTGRDGKEMHAQVIHLAAGSRLVDTVPRGSDRYLYTLRGAASLSGNGASLALPEDTFATLQEGLQFTLSNAGTAEAEVISIIAPPSG